MKFSWFIGITVCLSQISAFALETPPIRVRIKSSLQKIEFEGLGVQIKGREKPFDLVAIPQRQTIRITLDDLHGNSVWRVERNGKFEIHTGKNLVLKAIDLREKGKPVPNQIFLASNKSKFDLIGVLPLESYLVGVIASEMPLSWPMETLKAQAIAARSYAMVTMKERAKQNFHVESTIMDQVFTHIGNGPDNSPLVSKAKEAVKATEGYVLLGDKAQVLKAFYHSDCGGRTTTAKSVWGAGPSFGTAVDASCPSSPRAHWSLSVSNEILSEKLKAFLKNSELGVLESLSLIRPSEKERVEKVQLSFVGGEQILVSSQDFRAAVGFDQLKSTLFELKKNGEEYQFSGQGFGHGVGLCQWGARQMGQDGESFSEILAHYYPKAKLGSPQLKGYPNVSFRTEQELEVQTR